MSVAIIAALPREIAGLVRGTKPDAALVRQGIYLYALEDDVVVAAGMGPERVPFAVDAALQRGDVSMLVSVGLAGGCGVDVKAGSVLEARSVVDARTGESYTTGREGVVLVSAPGIASVREKARLHGTYGAAMVDMEAATVARLAAARGVGFRAIKGISDAWDAELSGLAKFEGKRGSFRTGAFAVHTALRPWTWGGTMRLGRDSSAALLELRDVLRGVVAE